MMYFRAVPAENSSKAVAFAPTSSTVATWTACGGQEMFQLHCTHTFCVVTAACGRPHTDQLNVGLRRPPAVLLCIQAVTADVCGVCCWTLKASEVPSPALYHTCAWLAGPTCIKAYALLAASLRQASVQLTCKGAVLPRGICDEHLRPESELYRSNCLLSVLHLSGWWRCAVRPLKHAGAACGDDLVCHTGSSAIVRLCETVLYAAV